MNLKFMVLGKNLKTEEDNNNDNWGEISSKLQEEGKELKEAIEEGDRFHIAEEIFDVIQVCIRALVMLVKEKYDIEQLNKRHNKKLVKRGWRHLKIIRVLLDR